MSTREMWSTVFVYVYLCVYMLCISVGSGPSLLPAAGENSHSWQQTSKSSLLHWSVKRSSDWRGHKNTPLSYYSTYSTISGTTSHCKDWRMLQLLKSCWPKTAELWCRPSRSVWPSQLTSCCTVCGRQTVIYIMWSPIWKQSAKMFYF